MQALQDLFIQESREFLQLITSALLSLEEKPGDKAVMNELFRAVHTLKGNSGMFDYPDMTKVLHAAEDLMDAVKSDVSLFDHDVADLLLDVGDLVSCMLDCIEESNSIPSNLANASAQLAEKLRSKLLSKKDKEGEALVPDEENSESTLGRVFLSADILKHLSFLRKRSIWDEATQNTVYVVEYKPESGCFFTGEDPLNLAYKMPNRLWCHIYPEWQATSNEEFDCYDCQLSFIMLTSLSYDEIQSHFYYNLEQISIQELDPFCLVPLNLHDELQNLDESVVQLLKAGEENTLTNDLINESIAKGLTGVDEIVTTWLQCLLEGTPSVAKAWCHAIISKDEDVFLSSIKEGKEHENAKPLTLGMSEVECDSLIGIITAQYELLSGSYGNNLSSHHQHSILSILKVIQQHLPESLRLPSLPETEATPEAIKKIGEWRASLIEKVKAKQPEPLVGKNSDDSPIEPQFRAEDKKISKVLKVDQAKVDDLMSLVGEMVVSKNALPYLARKAEQGTASIELAREIKAHYETVSRIVETLQDAVMQVRMMPVSVIFSRFDRLVRDVSKKLGKQVKLIKKGEETEADKNIIEVLNDPLIHIIRNSLDHGIETVEERRLAGKKETATLTISASNQVDSVIIQVSDDGKGIDPDIIKRKALDKGLIDENQADGLSDSEACDLIFLPGFSTAEQISDLSGRGVGMDVVRTTVQSVGGSVTLDSKLGRGTTLYITLPLSMAVSNIMVVESNAQVFGVPMDVISETVRVNLSDIKSVKHNKTIMLRGELIPVVELNSLLSINAPHQLNEENEHSLLILIVNNERVGLMIDGFKEVIDAILKPLPGDLGNLSCYSGTTLLGDGTVLMVLNVGGLGLCH